MANEEMQSMSNEEMQKTIRFILEQQAQFTVDIQQLRESQAKTDGTVNQLTAVVTLLAAETRAGFQELRGSISALVDAQIRTDEKVKELNDHLRGKIDALVDAQIQVEGSFNSKFEKLAEAQGRTDETVRNLAELFDRQLRERGSGG